MKESDARLKHAPSWTMLYEHQSYKYGTDASLSAEHGFLPPPPLSELPDSHGAWDKFHDRLPGLIGTRTIQNAIDYLSVLDANSEQLPDKYLSRAALVLGNIAHAYSFDQKNKRQLPSCVLAPWTRVCKRLGRKQAERTMSDSSYHNWKKKVPSGSMGIDNLELLAPVFKGREGEQEERLSNLVVVVMEARFAKALPLIVAAQEAVVNKQDDILMETLESITDIWGDILGSFGSIINLNSHGLYYINQVAWSKTFIKFVKGVIDGEENLIASAVTLFHVMDAFLGRSSFESVLGRQMKEKRKRMPKLHADFIGAIANERYSVKRYIESSANVELKSRHKDLANIYDCWFERHIRQAVPFMSLGQNAGRVLTNGGGGMDYKIIDEKLRQSNKERGGNLISVHTSAARESVKCLVKTKGREVYEVTFDIGSTRKWWPGDGVRFYCRHSDGEKTKTVNRIYSLTSLSGRQLRCLIRLISYPHNGQPRYGAASSFLTRKLESDEKSLSVRYDIVLRPRFHLPKDVTVPTIMIAGGVGIAPFISFAQQFSKRAGSHQGDNAQPSMLPHCLFISIHSEAEIVYLKLLSELNKRHILQVYYVFTGEPGKIARLQRGELVFSRNKGADHLHIDALLWKQRNLIAKRLEMKAHAYVCGGVGFAKTVQGVLTRIISSNQLAENPHEFFFKLIADNRYHQDVYASYPNNAKAKALWSLDQFRAYKKKQPNKCLIIVEGNIYDVTEYVEKHPGGAQVIRYVNGQDATDLFRRIHSKNTEADAWLQSFLIGSVGLSVKKRKLFLRPKQNDEQENHENSVRPAQGISALLSAGLFADSIPKGAGRRAAVILSQTM